MAEASAPWSKRARAKHPRAVLRSKFAQRSDRDRQLSAKLSQLVLHLWWSGRVDGPRDEAVAFQTAQRCGQHFLRDPVQSPAKLAESLGPAVQLHHQHDGPLVADAGEDLGNRPAVGAVEVTGFHESASFTRPMRRQLLFVEPELTRAHIESGMRVIPVAVVPRAAKPAKTKPR